MNKRNQAGKFSIGGVILLLILAYGGFCAVKYITAGFTVSQIDNEIREALFIRQGSDFSTEVGESVIRKILDKHKVTYNKQDSSTIRVAIEPTSLRVDYYAEYNFEIDFLLFKKQRFVTIDTVLNR